MQKPTVTIENLLGRQVEQILPGRKELEELMKKRKIRLYLGVDPTGRNLHLGHTIVLRKLQQFAELGHEAILVVGTGTVLAGDPSQRDAARARITKKEIAENIKTWKKQVSRVVDFSKVTIKENGDWLAKLRLPEILDIASRISASQLFQRDMFQARLRRGDTVWTHELLYPLLQGYDSVAMDVDLEIGGTDQLFNMLVGRELQKKMRNKEKYVLTTPMLLGVDGKPMSKTSGNTVNILDSPQEMYGKLMGMKDELTSHYAELCCDIPFGELNKLSPRDAKARVAKELVRIYHGQEQAQEAEEEFERVFREKQAPSSVPKVSIQEEMPLVEFLVLADLASSKAKARRLIEQRGVRVNGEVRQNPAEPIRRGMRLQVGKRRFVDT